MVRRIWNRLASIAAALRDAALAFRGFLLSTHAARLAAVAAGLWRRFRLPSVLVFAAAGVCLYTAWTVGSGLHALLSAGRDPGVLVWIASVLAAVVILELAAASALNLIRAGLRLARDLGRHRISALLWMGFALMLPLAGLPFIRGGEASASGVLAATAAVAGSFLLALWFQRTYRSPLHPAFRDFWSDLVHARHRLARPIHGG
jgi:hypothetical protein